MKDTIHSVLYGIKVAGAAFICLLGISLFFMNSDMFCNLLCRGLNLKVDPRFTGGETAADFFDDAEDDSGSGVLRYPANAEFTEGALDLVRYTVNKPVSNAKWQVNADYWQLSLTFRSGGPEVRNIMVYIGLEAGNPAVTLASSGSPLYDAAENVTFTADRPWNFAVWVAGGNGKIYDADGTFICDAEMNSLDEGRTVRIRIPLKDERLQQVYAAPTTWHYVLVGAYSQFDLGGFMPVEKRRSNSRGGTASAKDYSPLIPKVYDMLGDNSQLAGFDADALTKACVQPVVADMQGAATSAQDELEEVRGKLYTALAECPRKESAAESSQDDGVFGYPDLDQALAALEAAVQGTPTVAQLSHYGSCLAMKGGQSSVIQAVRLVNESFTYLDEAVRLSSSEDELIEALMNRASVAKSVPESVFGKSLTAAEDFVQLASLQKGRLATQELEEPEYEKLVLAYFHLNASECYLTAGHDAESLMQLQEAKKALE